ncbi:MAG: porin family protein [Ectothiorhodospiraceae bacterium]|nr:porin family protein [Ectothiorhodospiraceae bacterium]
MSDHVMAGNYWGAGLGNASFDLQPLGGAFDLEDGTAIKVFAGNRKGDFGVDFEVSLSEHDWKGSNGFATHNAASLIISGVAYHPLTDIVDLYGKVGLNAWTTTVDFIGTSYEGDNGIGLALGAGIEIAVSDKFHFRAEYQMLNGLEDGIDSGDISQVTFSGVYYY